MHANQKILVIPARFHNFLIQFTHNCNKLGKRFFIKEFSLKISAT